MSDNAPRDAPSAPTMITLGCRLNTYESEVMLQHAKAQGLSDVIIVNTCAVTNEAERQARQTIRRAHRENPSKQIIVTGCGAQVNPARYAALPGVSRVLGNQEKMRASSFAPDMHEKILVTDIMEATETAGHLISGFETRVRAFLEIQNGCDHRCTFCIIPYGRGNNRSVPMGHIVTQVQDLVAQGCREVIFTGVDITGYGTDLPGKPTLGQMVRRLLALVPQLPRLRLSSIDPAEVCPDLFHLIAHEPRLMPHFHISLQSGANMILKRMKRRHLREDVIAFTDRVRALRPDVVFGADIIAGFPTETPQMHQDSCDMIEQCGLTYLHVFPFSARQGTPAARMPQLPGEVIKARAQDLRTRGTQARNTFLERRVGMEAHVLLERPGFGHCAHYTSVQMPTDQTAHQAGQIVRARVTGSAAGHLTAVPWERED